MCNVFVKKKNEYVQAEQNIANLTTTAKWLWNDRREQNFKIPKQIAVLSRTFEISDDGAKLFISFLSHNLIFSLDFNSVF